MRAVVYDDYGTAPAVREVPDPVCPDAGAVLAVGATGVCRSDWHAWKGHDPVPLPHIPGHELAGVVAEVGPAVTRYNVGDRVTVPFVWSSRSVSPCNSDRNGWSRFSCVSDAIRRHRSLVASS